MSKFTTQTIYKHFNIKPVTILSDCSFENLMRNGMDYGTDCCPALEDKNIKCENCEHSKKVKDWYPPINNELLLRLFILLDMNSSHMFESVHYNQDIEDIRDAIFSNMINAKDQYNKIQELLNVYCSEYKGM